MSGRISDAAQRRTALDPSRSFIVQAPAGAGKTGLLTQRFLRLLSVVDRPEEILAITFTRKAATEMRNRILSALRDAAEDGKAKSEYEAVTLELAASALARSQDLDWKLTENPGRLQVRTIDSLCNGLARRLPLLSRSGGPTKATDDANDQYRLAARRAVALADDEDYGAPMAALLEHLDNNPNRAEKLLAAMLARRDQWLRNLGGVHHESLSRTALESSLGHLVDEMLAQASAKLPASLAAELFDLARFARDHLPPDQMETPLGRWDNIDPPRQGSTNRADGWQAMGQLLLTAEGKLRSPRGMNKRLGFPPPGKDPRLQDAKDRIGALLHQLENYPHFVAALAQIKELPAPVYSDAQWAMLEQLPTILNLAYAELKLVFSEQGITDHTEVNTAAGQALGTDEAPTDLALVLDYRLRHILVDEFQDTSRTQFDLLKKLTTGWQPDDGHSLFAVGDPMQSIYRFRQAEVSLFIEARESGIGDLPLDSLVLTTNFRSKNNIIQWVNNIFKGIFPAENNAELGAIRYTASEAFHAAETNGGVEIHPLFNGNPEIESRQVADLVQQAMEAGHESIAVLARSRTHLSEVSSELTRRRLPFQAVDVHPLGERLSVRELRALTRALILPHDRVSWLALLRAPWCGMGLSDLTRLTDSAPKAPVIELLQNQERVRSLSDKGATRANHLLSVMTRARENRRRSNLRDNVEAAWLALGGPSCLRASADRAAAGAFLDLLGNLESAADLSLLERLDTALAQLYAPPDPDASPQIQLMTIHKAKGLEFDTVILPGLGRAPRGDERKLAQWMEWQGGNGTSHFVIAPIADSETSDEPLERLLRKTEKEKQSLETVRTLYVAATRARKSLHLIGGVRAVDDAEKFSPRRDTLLHSLWPVLRTAYQDALGEIDREALESEKTNIGPTILPPLVRAEETWKQPEVHSPLPDRTQPPMEAPEPEYVWAGGSARHIGTVIHAYLDNMARDGLEDWDQARIISLRHSFRLALQSLAVPNAELDSATERVVLGLTNAIADERGRWLLAAHSESRSEYPVTAIIDGHPKNLIIDRTFIDAEGTRWIVDYKTGTHEGGGLDAFLDSEEERYRPQLEGYAEVMSRLDPGRPIRLALYFPLLNGWREWSPATC